MHSRAEHVGSGADQPGADKPQDRMDVLVIEDDLLMCDTIRNAWPLPGDRLHIISSYKQSVKLIHSAEIGFFDGVLLDIHLPDGDGLTILRTIRDNAALPVVLMSGTGTAESRAAAFALGADDYLMKPFSIREMQARLARLVTVRREKKKPVPRLKFQVGEVICDLQRRVLSHDGREIGLTCAEMRLLAALHLNANHTCSKSYLYKNSFFRDFDPNDKTLDVYVSRLRKKFAELNEPSAELICTVRGYGYMVSEHDDFTDM